jgi:hypothetical protein
MKEELEKWLQEFVENKRSKGIDCKITPYRMGKSSRYMFEVNGELRNIENYLTMAELLHYKRLINGQKNKLDIK